MTGHSTLTAGALLVIPALVSVAATAASPLLLNWLRPGYAMGLGVLVALTGAVAMLMVVTAGPSTSLLVGAAALMAAGVAPVFALGTNVVLTYAPVQQTGSAQSLQEVGGSLVNTSGLALGGTLAYLGYSRTLQDTLPSELDTEAAEQSAQSIGGAITASQDLPAELAARLTTAAQDGFTVATRDAYLLAVAGLAVLAVLVVWGLRSARVERSSSVRVFGTATSDRTIQFGDRRIFVTPAVEKADGGPLSAYSATFGRGEQADLPAPYEEVWVVVSGALLIRGNGKDVVVRAGDFVQVPEQAPGEVEELDDTLLVCVSVPAH